MHSLTPQPRPKETPVQYTGPGPLSSQQTPTFLDKDQSANTHP